MSSNWHQFVRKYSQENDIPYKEALREASDPYKEWKKIVKERGNVHVKENKPRRGKNARQHPTTVHPTTVQPTTVQPKMKKPSRVKPPAQENLNLDIEM